MKKQYPTSKKSRSATGWHKHLKKEGKRVANKGTRKLSKRWSEERRARFEESRTVRIAENEASKIIGDGYYTF